MYGLEQYLLSMIYHYRYWGLFTVLSFGMIGVPVPDEFIMAFSGFQTSIGHMNFVKTLFFASLGSFVGMNLSYWIGRSLGIPFLHRIAPFLHMNENKIRRAEGWFQRFGDRLIVIGYFFPGFRHFVAYFSGMSELNYARYTILSGIGALLWSTTFITLGNLLGTHWQGIIALLHRYLSRGGIILALFVGIIYLYTSNRNKAKTHEE
ncbi:DedA family protein [Desulfitobacterium metallireducens]|uniref:Membrane protein n=1 Tax=Desulfitobacterium metallireducens DSM 15288 TaxID=871968 RepID=W0EC31_9FIRM|nr:DedA family protein [Desulfitobacterium metallireducens]AHF06749.1 membrane protein [Desulfitobacterium metallireducens DSM 15288]